ncbi:phage integrase family protein [Rhizobium sp. PP-CC-2G-626]|nr:phage integrase family protein [Rhizobium sp. PP-CC-2G-626]
MPLKVIKRKDSPNLWLRGNVRGIAVYESTKTADTEAAETIRVLRERELLDESIFGKKAVVTFNTAANAYLAGGGSARFLTPLVNAFGNKLLRDIHQNDLDLLSLKLYPDTTAVTRNRQLFTPFIAVWNHAARNEWAEPRQWARPRKQKGTRRRPTTTRSGTRPVAYERAAEFVFDMSPAPAMVMTALFFTGMRPVELFTLEPSDVDVAGRWLTLEHTKTGEPRGVPMHEFLVPLFTSLLKRKKGPPQIFQNYRGTAYQLFEERGGQLNGSIRGTRARLAKRGIRIDDVSPYTGRHTVSTQLVINQIHPHVKDQILGHAVDSMSRHYTNVPQAPLIDAINTLPVPDIWRAMSWWADPLEYVGKHVKWGAGPKDATP